MTRVLVMKSGGIGDVLLVVPSLNALLRTYQPCSLTFLGPSRVLPLLEGFADRTMSIEGADVATWMGPEPDERLAEVFAGHDIIISWFGHSCPEFRHNVGTAAPGRTHFFPPFPPDGGIHVSDHYLRCLRDHGIISRKEKGVPFSLRFPVCRINPDGPPAFTLVLHPGSGGAYKNWPPEKYIRLALWTIDSFDARVVLVSGPSDEEAVRAVSGGLPWKKVTMAGSLPLLQIARIIAGSTIFVGNDSGISHLAALTDVFTIAVFGPTDPRVWGVRGSRALSLRKVLPCSPCTAEEARRCRERKCLNEIQVEEVIQHIVVNAGTPGTGLHRDMRV